MSNARNLARVVADTSGAIAATNLANAVPADGSITAAKLANGAVALGTKVSGVLPDANAPSGSVLQVVQATNSSAVSTSSQSWVATGLTATITPISASSKILILVDLVCYAGTANEGLATIYRGSTRLGNDSGFADWYTGASDIITTCPLNYLDSPSTTSATTYSVHIRNNQGGSIQTNIRGNTSTLILMEVAP